MRLAKRIGAVLAVSAVAIVAALVVASPAQAGGAGPGNCSVRSGWLYCSNGVAALSNAPWESGRGPSSWGNGYLHNVNTLRTTYSSFYCFTDQGSSRWTDNNWNYTWYWAQGDDNGNWGWVYAANLYTYLAFDRNPAGQGMRRCSYSFDGTTLRNPW